jgi:hypothetical protein
LPGIARDVARIAGHIEVTHNWRITDPRPTHPANASVVRPSAPEASFAPSGYLTISPSISAISSRRWVDQRGRKARWMNRACQGRSGRAPHCGRADPGRRRASQRGCCPRCPGPSGRRLLPATPLMRWARRDFRTRQVRHGQPRNSKSNTEASLVRSRPGIPPAAPWPPRRGQRGSPVLRPRVRDLPGLSGGGRRLQIEAPFAVGGPVRRRRLWRPYERRPTVSLHGPRNSEPTASWREPTRRAAWAGSDGPSAR